MPIKTCKIFLKTKGQAYSVSPDATFPYKPQYYQPFGTGGKE